MEEAVPYLGIAPSHPPAILDGGDDMLLIGVEHLFQLDVEILERFPVLAQSRAARAIVAGERLAFLRFPSPLRAKGVGST